MLSVSDNSTGFSYAYIRKNLFNSLKRTISLEYEVTPASLIKKDVYITMFRGLNRLPMAGIVMGEDGSIKLKSWNYVNFPSSRFYPGNNQYPKSSRRRFPPFYPVNYNPPLYPPFNTPIYTSKSDMNPNVFFPGYSQPEENILYLTLLHIVLVYTLLSIHQNILLKMII